MAETEEGLGHIPVPVETAPFSETQVCALDSPNADVASAAEKAESIGEPPDVVNIPPLTLWQILLLFLGFGVRAFGGPVAQKNMFKDELVLNGKWISMKRFMRAYAVYQVLPGPEATELAVYFGYLAGGPVGGILGGLGFIIPGILLMLIFSWFYYTYGIGNRVFIAVFHGLQPAVCAMVIRAAHKIGEMTCRHHDGTGTLDLNLLFIIGVAAFESVLSVNFFVTKAHLIPVYLLLKRKWYAMAAVACIVPLIVVIGVIAGVGPMGSLVPQGFGIAQKLGNSIESEFLVSLVGGLVSFGGAYTSIPFIQVCAVLNPCCWLPGHQ